MLAAGRVRITSGKEVLEVRPNISWDKGRAIDKIASQFADSTLAVFFGDDVTDEDGFGRYWRTGWNIRVCWRCPRTHPRSLPGGLPSRSCRDIKTAYRVVGWENPCQKGCSLSFSFYPVKLVQPALKPRFRYEAGAQECGYDLF